MISSPVHTWGAVSPDARTANLCGSGKGQLQRFTCQWRFLWTAIPCCKVREISTKIKMQSIVHTQEQQDDNEILLV